VAISESELTQAKAAISIEFEDELHNGMINDLFIEEDLSIIALVGSNMREQVGVSGKMFNALGKNGISVKAIAQGSSERNISAIIPSKNLKKAVNVLHEAFFLSDLKRVNLFIIGVGNVGKVFLKQLQAQQQALKDQSHVRIEVTGIANSKRCHFDEEGIRLSDWQMKLEEGEAYEAIDFIKRIESYNLRNSILIDITASKDIAALYYEALSRNISVVTPNKIAATSTLDEYQKLKEISLRNQSSFLYETNVAAGLPVLSTLKDLIMSGDQIHRIEAVLSGTLNYLFNTYDGTTSFAEVIQQAKAEGLTEPDPRLDLFGEDVMRKILILARECGSRLEIEDVAFETFMPEKCHESQDLDSFYDCVSQHEDHFMRLYEKAKESNEKLRVTASFADQKAKVALTSVPFSHPFYNLEGKDNIVLFYTNRYSDQPLVVKGAGAGAAVTASGIFADVLKVSVQ
jgi:aspartokinase/homoserine dehydrogenase 1